MLFRLHQMEGEVRMFGLVEMILPMKEIGHGMERMREMERSFGREMKPMDPR